MKPEVKYSKSHHGNLLMIDITYGDIETTGVVIATGSSITTDNRTTIKFAAYEGIPRLKVAAYGKNSTETHAKARAYASTAFKDISNYLEESLNKTVTIDHLVIYRAGEHHELYTVDVHIDELETILDTMVNIASSAKPKTKEPKQKNQLEKIVDNYIQKRSTKK